MFCKTESSPLCNESSVATGQTAWMETLVYSQHTTTSDVCWSMSVGECVFKARTLSATWLPCLMRSGLMLSVIHHRGIELDSGKRKGRGKKKKINPRYHNSTISSQWYERRLRTNPKERCASCGFLMMWQRWEGNSLLFQLRSNIMISHKTPFLFFL